MGAFNGVYDFDFGDSASGTWAISGLSKNRQRGGPIAAHVYDLPGTYTISVGGSTLTVTVQNPDTVFVGSNTLCVSASASYAGCPAGAATQTTLPTSYAGKRVLLRRGESFGAITPRATDSGFQVGAFGIGAKPNVTGVLTGTPATGSTVTSDWTIMDLNIGTGTVSIDASTVRFLLYRNDIVQYGDSVSMVNIGTAAGYYQSHGHPAMQWPREVFLVENNVQGVAGTRTSSPNVTAMGYFLKSAILGNTMDRAHEHTLRIWATSKTIIAHNALGGSHHPEASGIGIRHALKIHSAGTQAFTDLVSTSPTAASSQVVIANNVIGSSSFPGSWLAGLGPQNADAGTVEGLEDFLAENNVFIRGPHSSSEIQWRGRRMTHRGNTLQGGGTPDISRNGANYDPGLSAWDGPYIAQ
jgi:hypothetical protein